MTRATQPRFKRVSYPILALATAALLALSGTALALNPSRPLTQAGQRIWQMEQGLAQPTITCIRQRQDGYLWLGTRTGLVRFDGMRFATFDDQPFLHEWIHDLAEDGERNLWIATDGAGLVRLEGLRATQFGRVDGLPSDNVRALLVDRQGRLWVGTDRGLAWFNAGRFVAIGEKDGLPALDVHALCQGTAGEIWVGGDKTQLGVWNGERFNLKTLTSIGAAETINALLFAENGTLWIGSSAGLVKLDHDREERFTTTDGLGSDAVLCVAEGRNESIYVGTKNGFSRVRGGAIENFRTEQGLSQSMVYTIYEDHEGTLWVGTKHGLNQFIDRRTVPFTTSEGLPSNNTGPIFQDRAGTIWAGTLDEGLARQDGHRFVAVPELSGDSKVVYTLADGADGDLWVGTDKGLCRTRGGKVVEKFGVAEGLPAASVQCICLDHGGTLWAGTPAGLAALRDGRFVPIPPAGEAATGAVLTMIDFEDTLLVSIEGRGVFRCSSDRLEPFPAAGDTTTDVDAFCRDADGLLWMGTRGGGLRLIDGNRCHRFTSRDGLYDDEIFGVVADDQDRLWLACSKGCFSVSRSNLREFAAGALARVETVWFSPFNAQQALECQDGVQPAVCKSRDGRIWFSTIRGLIVIDPSHLKRELPPTTVVVEDVIVNGQSESPSRIPTVGPSQANLTFRYTALSFSSPARITFRYRLEGFDKDWIDAGNRREAFYTNLPPGHYRFRVLAHNSDEKEYEAASPVAFTVSPHFYQTTWFAPLCGTLLVAGAWSVYRLRVRRIRANLNAILSERGRIARELHDTLMQGFSGVTMEMQALAARLPPSAHQSTLNDIIQDAGSCLREARRSVAGLRGDRSGFSVSLAQGAQQITETSDVRLELRLEELSRRFPDDVEYNLLRIAQEAITNAVKHSGARTIEVVLNSAPREVRLSIRDDGAGFETGADTLRHYGLIGMRERAAHIGAKLHLQSEPGSGTSILVVLPTVTAALPAPV